MGESGHPGKPHPLECLGANFCVGTDYRPRGSLFISHDPMAGNWTSNDLFEVGINRLNGVDCPSPARCFAVSKQGRVLTSDNPHGSSEPWSVETELPDPFNGELLAIDCPTVSFCVAANRAGRLFTRDGTWNAGVEPDGIGYVSGISCSSPGVCFVADHAGSIFRGAGDAWTRVRDGTGKVMSAIACPSAALCVAAGEGGVVASTDGGATWTAHPIAAGNSDLFSIACPTADLCVAGDYQGLLYTSFDPAIDQSWRVAAVGTAWWWDIDCSSESLCVAVDHSGQTFASSDPAGGAAAWEKGPNAPAATGASCAGATCLVAFFDGHAWTATGSGVPFNTSLPTISGTHAGEPLRCSPGTWSPAATTVRYQWESGGVEIAGATGETYTATQTGRLRCRVTAVNAVGEATARGAVTVVDPPPPVPEVTPQPQASPQPPSPPPPPAPFSARIAPRAPRLAALARSGLSVAVTCSASCTVTLRLGLDARDARRLRLRRGGAIGTARATLTRAGTTTVRIRLTAAARRAIARARPARLRVTLGATEASKRPVTGGKTLTLRM